MELCCLWALHPSPPHAFASHPFSRAFRAWPTICVRLLIYCATTSDQFSSFTLHPSYYTPLLFPSHPPLLYTYRVPSSLLICTYSLSMSCLIFALVNQPGSLFVARFWLASCPSATPRPTANLQTILQDFESTFLRLCKLPNILLCNPSCKILWVHF